MPARPRVAGELECLGFGIRLMELFCIVIMVMVKWVYTFVKTHQVVHFKWVNFICM